MQSNNSNALNTQAQGQDAPIKSEATNISEVESVKSSIGTIMTRGVLIDIPRLKGVPYLEPGTVITLQDIEAWEKRTGVKVTAGDAVFIRTGRWARRAAKTSRDGSGWGHHRQDRRGQFCRRRVQQW